MKYYLDTTKENSPIITQIDSLRNHDFETFKHSERVSNLSRYIGIYNKLHEDDIELLVFSGLLHDIGKINVPLNILKKRTNLSYDEREIINQHYRNGFEILTGVGLNELAEIVVAHQEFQKSSYPRNGIDRRDSMRNSCERRSLNTKTNELAQIVALEDLYDALSSERPYKKPIHFSQILPTLSDQFTGNKQLINYFQR